MGNSLVIQWLGLGEFTAVSLDLILPHSSVGKESACNAGDPSSIPVSGRYPGEGKGYPLQYSSLENSMDCIVHEVAKSRSRLSNFHFQGIKICQVSPTSGTAKKKKKGKVRQIVQMGRIEKESLEEGNDYKTRDLGAHKSLGQQAHPRAPPGMAVLMLGSPKASVTPHRRLSFSL